MLQLLYCGDMRFRHLPHLLELMKQKKISGPLHRTPYGRPITYLK
jgi:hypothetical protein